MTRTRVVDDLSRVDTNGFGYRVIPWWGALAFMALEGMGFVLAIGVFLYLVFISPEWPLGYPAPDLLIPNLFTGLLLVSIVPNWFVKQRAQQHDNRALKPLLILMSLIGVLSLVIRGFEFANLPIRWDTNVYGSLLWVLLGLHTFHLLTDVGDTIMMTFLFFTRHVPNGRFSDADENGMYWLFVVLGWLPIYALLYWAPRIGGG